MDFVRSNFGTKEPLPVEHVFPHSLAGLLRTHSKLAKNEEKSVQLAEIHLCWSYFLQSQNTYFTYYILCIKSFLPTFRGKSAIP